MNIEQLKLDLAVNSDNHLWTVKDGRLNHLDVDGNLLYFYDNIKIDGFLPFRHLTLVSGNDIVSLGFFEKLKLYKLVVKQYYLIEHEDKWRTLSQIKVSNVVPDVSNQRKSKFQIRLEEMQRRQQELKDKKKSSYGSVHDDYVTIRDKVIETFEKVEDKEDDFRKKVNAEKERIRKILRGDA